MDAQHYFPYHEPSLVQTLILSSFFVFLNAARALGDRVANVGILGELFIGMIFGSPLAGILDNDWQSAFTAVGYIGLIVLVLEGGLTTDLELARRNLWLSLAVALTGLLAPILLSLILLHLAFGFTLLQAFSAGAALSTTSLGTTFTVISQAGFGDTKLGAVLTSAAITDDVVGLVLLQVIVSLGQARGSSASNSDQSAALGWAIARPLLASLAMLGVSYILMKFLVVPVYRRLTLLLESKIHAHWHAYNLVVALLVAHAYCAVASASGSAFVAGLVLSVLSEVSRKACGDAKSFAQTYNHCIEQVQLYILRPLFFASIGYAIPIRSLFSGRIVWQGICYTLIGVFSKLICGVFVMLSHTFTQWRRSKARMPKAFLRKKAVSSAQAKDAQPSQATPTFPPSTNLEKPSTPSLLPVSALLGSAMVARGEISLLILNLAREASPALMPDNLFYIAIWATLLCTIIGPLTVGIIVKRMKRTDKALPAEWGPVAKSRTPSSSITTASSNTASIVVEAPAPILQNDAEQKPKGPITNPPVAHRVLSSFRPRF